MERIRLRTRSAQCLEDVTQQVNEAVHASGVEEGVCHLFVPHTTAGLVINENDDPDVGRDLIEKLEALVPSDAPYHHYEGNAHAHIKSSLVGQSAAAPVAAGRLALGRWQAVFFAEFDGPRERELLVTVVAARAPSEALSQERRAGS
ncbi:MAG: secondary thiamine-phosphate synthase enzyme YjbQ [Dehalococcoidia bacterium]|nr:secondary thiamine-phosphate synthase enzyme YjbQ [Dehalococcoidia bacterium]